MDMKPAPETVSQRLKGQFAPAYLTLTSIIQGVALSTLAVRVEGNYPQFDATDWLLTVATFIGFLAVWNEYLMQALAYVWMPTLLDSLVPFAFLASELFASHFVYYGLRGWLLSVSLIFVVGTVAQFLTFTQARNLVEENRDVARVLAPYGRIRAVLGAVIIVFCLCAWAFYDPLHLAQVQIFVALLALVGIIVFVGSSVPGWNRLLAYARGEQRTGRQRKGQAESPER
ncbi:MAG TPA: hypothetical protein VF026_27105 [Ktedonobacteraceae bacterium]